MQSSVEPGEIRSMAAEQTGECINQDRKGRLAKLTARLAKRQTTLHPVVAFDTVGASRALSPKHTKSQGPLGPVVGGFDAVFTKKHPKRCHLPLQTSGQATGIIFALVVATNQVAKPGVPSAPLPPVGGALAMWHKRCNSFNAHLPQAERSGLDFSAKPLAVRIRGAKQVCRRLTQV